jgi:tetratricopeptide (TPR) repeat protein
LPEQDVKRKASELLQKGRLAEAIQEYQTLLEQSKRPNPAIVNLIGDIYVKQGDHASGFAHFLKACKQYADEGLFHNGIAVAKKILRLDKERTDVYGTLGDLYARQGLGMDAVKFLNEYARRKEEANEYPAALAAFAQACETLADCPELNIAYGEMLERVKRVDDAAANFRRAAETYAERGLEAQAQHWTNRAREALSGETRGGKASAAASDERGPDGDVWELMSLRDLGEQPQAAAPPAIPPAPAQKSKSKQGAGAGVQPRSQWGIFDPATNPDVPPPPPLPGGPAAQPAPIAANELAPPAAPPPSEDATLVLEPPRPRAPDADPEWEEAAGQAPADPPWQETMASLSDLRDLSGPDPVPEDRPTAELAGDGLTLDIVSPDLSFRAVKGPTSYAEAEPVAPPTPDRLELEPPASSAVAARPPVKPAVAPPPDDRKAAGGKVAPISLSNLRGIIMPPSTKKKKDAEPPVAPSAPVPSETAPVAAPSPAPADPGRRERAIVIGDDTELVREGGDVKEVIQDFREATAQILGAGDHRAHYDLGTTYLEMELFDEAAAEFRLASGGPAFALASQEMLGYCHLRQGHIERAVTELLKGLDLRGHEEGAKIGLYYNLGIACGALGRQAEAIEAFRRVQALDPEFRDAKTRLARLLSRNE